LKTSKYYIHFIFIGRYVSPLIATLSTVSRGKTHERKDKRSGLHHDKQYLKDEEKKSCKEITVGSKRTPK
jgi:hypothetical protein